MRRYCAFLFFGMVFFSGAAFAQEDPDLPKLGNGTIDKSEYLRLRSDHVGKLRGAGADPNLRINAVQTRQSQLDKRAPLTNAITAWAPIGPAPIPNGQTQTTVYPVSGRVTAIAVHPTNPNIVYVGAAQGGVYRTTDGGSTWTPIFDTAASLAIGAIAIAPSNPSTIYVGTGEASGSCDSYAGVGLYRIDNANSSPSLVGPINPIVNVGGNSVHPFTGLSISKILVHPTDPATIFVSTTYGIYGIGCSFLSGLPPSGSLGWPGLYRSTNATSAAGSVSFLKLGTSATGVVEYHAISDMVMEPGNPNNIIVGGSKGVFRTTVALSGAPTFTASTGPSGAFGAVSATLAINKVGSTTNVLLATSESVVISASTYTGKLYLSTDGGATFPTTITAASGFCSGQCGYDQAVAVDPATASNILIGGNVRGTNNRLVAKSINGGSTFSNADVGLHADVHAIAYAPSNSSIVYTGNDGGIFKSTDGGSTWTSLNNTGFYATQFQSVAVHSTDPYFTIGGTQDNGTNWYQPNQTWTRADYGDGGYALIDQSSSSTTAVTLYHTYFNSASQGLVGFARVTTEANAHDGSWSFFGCGGTSNGLPCENSLFYAPMALGPGTPNTLYFGTVRLFRSSDQGTTMVPVSQNPLWSTSTPISAIGISPQNDNVRIVGLTNGKVFATTNGSTTLTNVTGTFPGDPGNANTPGFISRAVIHPTNANTAFVTFSYYAPAGQGIYKTTNLNAATPTWTASASGIPSVPINAFVIDPDTPSNMYAGTDVGVYSSTDGGATWAPFGVGLPVVAVFDLAIQRTSHTLRAATHGRGIWQASIAPTPANITITTNIPGLPFTTSGIGCAPGSYNTPQTLAWTPGAVCNVTFNSFIYFNSGSSYDYFVNWTDGVFPSARQITAPSVDTTYTANFSIYHQLVTQANPAAGGTVGPATAYLIQGSVVPLSATASSGYTFTGWSGTGTGSYTGTNPAGSVTVNAPITETANFAPIGTFTARVNAGGTVYNDPLGNLWSPDSSIAGTYTFFTQNPIRNTNRSYLYQSERFSLGSTFQYVFPSVPNGNYSVRLLFAETYFTQTGQRRFNVNINGASALTNFDIVAAAGASNTAVDTIHAVNVTTGQIVIQFVPVTSNPKISGIEILPLNTAIAVSPGLSDPLPSGAVQQFYATVIGNANTAVTWTLSPNIGSVNQAGVYTAPTVTNPTKVTLTATSQADPTKFATATIQLVPQPWVSQDIGNVNLPGSSTYTGNAFNLLGSGDLFGSADALRYTYNRLSGDGTIVARVNQPFTGQTANKSGVMLRYDLSPGSAHAFTGLYSAIVGLYHWRPAPGGVTSTQFGAAGIPWVRLTRTGSTLSSYVSNDATSWIPVGTPQTLYSLDANIGLAASNGFSSTLDTVTFDNVDLSTSPVTVSINEGLASLAAGQVAQFTANVLGTANTAVTWSISPAGLGSINASNGTYTAPATVNPSPQTVTITATSAADPSKSASVVVFLGAFQTIRVNCGGPSHYDPLGTFWYGDIGSVGGAGNVYSSGNTIANTQTPYLYQSERFNAGAPLVYKYYVPNGSYNVTLKFAEIYFTSAGQRVMNVSINGNPVLSNFDIFAQAGANTAYDATFPVTVSGGSITITLAPAVTGHAPKVNAIQIQ